MWTNWISFIIGLWIFFSGFFMNLRAEWNLIIFGILAIIFGFATYRSWQGVVNGIAGIWLFLSGIWFMILGPANFIITGIIIAILGIWGALAENPTRTVSHKTA
jgi:hypothetical protein